METIDEMIERHRTAYKEERKQAYSDTGDMEQFSEQAEKYQRQTETILDDDGR